MKRFLNWLFWPKPKINGLFDIENIVLIIINLLPILGVLLFNWNVFPILLIYCVEAVIGFIFELSRQPDVMQTAQAPKFLTCMFLAIFILLGLIIPLAVIFFTSNEKQTSQSIQSYSFWIAILLFSGNQIISQIKNSKKIRKYKMISQKSNQSLFILKPFLIVIIAMIIALSGTYTLSMIALILFKTFLDMRSYFRKQTITVISHVKY
jgi:hypothetical protein